VVKVVVPALVAIVGLIAVLTSGGGGKSAPGSTSGGEIFLEPAAVVGVDPYTPSVAIDQPGTTTTTKAVTTTTVSGQAPPVAVQGVSGAQPGLYGGTQSNSSCDAAKMVQFLAENPAKAAAWAGVQGIQPSAIAAFVDTLTPVVLQDDTRVTNHGFKDGKATTLQSVLEAGSAVLVDDRGTPRVRCKCGNPLLPPEPVTGQTAYVGSPWPGFSPEEVKVVVPATQPLERLVLTDTTSGASFARPVGSAGVEDVRVASPATTTTTTAASIPAPNALIAKEGQATASSTYSDAFRSELSIDGRDDTSWFSKGNTDGPTSTYTWTHPKDDLITLVRIVGNGANADPANRNGFGFESVTIQVLDGSNDVDFEQTVVLPGTPDPTVEVRPGVKGRTVRLIFRGHEDPTCGGFAELVVGVTR
jgi:hypothetical protein